MWEIQIVFSPILKQIELENQELWQEQTDQAWETTWEYMQIFLLKSPWNYLKKSKENGGYLDSESIKL